MRENLLTKRDAASLLNVSVRTIERYIFEGKLMAVHLSTRCLRIAPAAIDKFLRNCGGAQ